MAVVEVETRFGNVTVPYNTEPFGEKFPTPCMERREPGDVVAIPTLPLCITLRNCPCKPTKSVLVAMSALAVVVPVLCVFPWMLTIEPGVELPMPRNELVVSVTR